MRHAKVALLKGAGLLLLTAADLTGLPRCLPVGCLCKAWRALYLNTASGPLQADLIYSLLTGRQETTTVSVSRRCLRT